jgi:hypothetical protein
VTRRVLAGVVVFGLAASVVGVAVAAGDFRVERDTSLRNRSNQLFGVNNPLTASSTSTAPLAAANADASTLATFAKGLQVRVVSQGAGANIDQMGLWPDDLAPNHLIACNEQGTSQPGQSINIETGDVVTLLTGLTS